jgi:HEAT repeat protein
MGLFGSREAKGRKEAEKLVVPVRRWGNYDNLREKQRQEEAVPQLIELGEPAVPVLIDEIRTGRADQGRKVMFQILGAIGQPAVAPLAQLLSDGNELEQLSASITLEEMGADGLETPYIHILQTQVDKSKDEYADPHLVSGAANYFAEHPCENAVDVLIAAFEAPHQWADRNRSTFSGADMTSARQACFKALARTDDPRAKQWVQDHEDFRGWVHGI